MSAEYGWVYDYATGTAIRPATAEEQQRTDDMMTSGKPGAYTGAWRDEDGRAVYVDF